MTEKTLCERCGEWVDLHGNHCCDDRQKLIERLRDEHVSADHIEELVKDRDLWKSRYEHHNHERLETLNLNAMQASKIGSLMNTIAKLEKKISKLEGK